MNTRIHRVTLFLFVATGMCAISAIDCARCAGRNGSETGAARQRQPRADRGYRVAKVLIYAGYSHINEGGLVGGVPTLAERLRRITGDDPLTIDQTVMSEQISWEYEHPIYQYLMAHTPISEPTVFVNEQGKPWTLQPGIRDITLF